MQLLAKFHYHCTCGVTDEWSMEDRVTFEQAFQYHGKNFQRIRAMLPDKPISSLVKHYYLRKKSYSQYSLMDKHAKKNWKRIRCVCGGEQLKLSLL